jgi:hypothetical protein
MSAVVACAFTSRQRGDNKFTSATTSMRNREVETSSLPMPRRQRDDVDAQAVRGNLVSADVN